MQVSELLDVMETKSNDEYERFVSYLEVDYDWIGYPMRNAKITSSQITEYLEQKSTRSLSPETVTMSTKERDRERSLRENRTKHHQDLSNNMDYRERLMF